MLGFSRFFRYTGIVKHLDGGSWSEVRPILQYPDNFLIFRNFHELRTMIAAAT